MAASTNMAGTSSAMPLQTQYVPITIAQNPQPQVYTPSMLANNGGYVTQPQQSTRISPIQLASGVTKIANPTIWNGGSVMGGFNQINQLGAKYIGTELPGVSGTGLLGGTSATGALAGAGIGGLVGTFNPLVKNKTGGQVGGAVGGAIGMSVGGPIGSAVGGFIGSTLGGLVGGGKPHPGASYEAILDDKYDYTQPSTLAKHMGTEGVTQISQEMSPYLKNLQYMGIKIPAETSVGTYIESSGNGVLFYRNKDERNADTKTNKITYDPNNNADRARAYNELSMQLAKQGGATPEQLQSLQSYIPEGTQASQGIGVAAPNVAVKDLNTKMPNNDWAGFMKSYNARNA